MADLSNSKSSPPFLQLNKQLFCISALKLQLNKPSCIYFYCGASRTQCILLCEILFYIELLLVCQIAILPNCDYFAKSLIFQFEPYNFSSMSIQICECPSNLVWKYHLKGAKRGQKEVFAALPGKTRQFLFVRGDNLPGQELCTNQYSQGFLVLLKKNCSAPKNIEMRCALGNSPFFTGYIRGAIVQWLHVKQSTQV